MASDFKSPRKEGRKKGKMKRARKKKVKVRRERRRSPKIRVFRTEGQREGIHASVICKLAITKQNCL